MSAGLIHPPPDMKTVVDKTATFVANHGKEFETKIRTNEENNPKFQFLQKENPYHAYYLDKIQEIKRASQAPEPEEEQKPAEPEEESADGSDEEEEEDEEDGALQAPEKNPCPTEFRLATPANMTSEIRGTIRLTAQAVARHGQAFQKNISTKEASNPRFDFLKPSHTYYPYFEALVSQYGSILFPENLEERMARLQQGSASRRAILRRCQGSRMWKLKQKEEEEEKKRSEEDDRTAFLRIDWKDFSVVETITFPDDTPITLPPAGKPPAPPGKAPAGARPPAPPGAPPKPPGPPPGAPPKPPGPPPGTAPVPPPPVAPVAPPPVMPPSVPASGAAIKVNEEEEAEVVTGYKRSAKGQSAPGAAPVLVKDKDGLVMTAEQVANHMRVRTLDPQWKENQRREREKDSLTNLVADAQVSKILEKQLANADK